jgi:hypothetical protein
MLLSRFAIVMWLFRQDKASYTEIFAAMFPAWVLAIMAAGTGIMANRVLPLGNWVNQIIQSHVSEQIARTVVAIVEIGLAGSVCTIVFLILARLLLAEHLRDALRACPSRLRKPGASVLRLGSL